MRYRYSHALDWDQQSWSLPISLNPVSTQPGEGHCTAGEWRFCQKLEEAVGDRFTVMMQIRVGATHGDRARLNKRLKHRDGIAATRLNPPT